MNDRDLRKIKPLSHSLAGRSVGRPRWATTSATRTNSPRSNASFGPARRSNVQTTHPWKKKRAFRKRHGSESLEQESTASTGVSQNARSEIRLETSGRSDHLSRHTHTHTRARARAHRAGTRRVGEDFPERTSASAGTFWRGARVRLGLVLARLSTLLWEGRRRGEGEAEEGGSRAQGPRREETHRGRGARRRCVWRRYREFERTARVSGRLSTTHSPQSE